MRRLRWIIRVGGALAVLVALVFVAGLVALNSESFARWALGIATARTDGAVRLESVSGTLGGGLRIGNVAVDWDSGTASASDIYLELDWRSLVARSVVLDTLEIERVDIELRTTGATTTASEPMDFSMLVLIRYIGIDTIELQSAGQSWPISDVSLDLRLLRNRLELGSIAAVFDQLRITGDLAATLARQLDLAGTVCIDGTFAEERVLGCVESSGTLERLVVDAQLQLPFPLEVSGSTEVAADGVVDLQASWEQLALTNVPDLRSAAGTARLTGTIDRPRVAADGAIEYAGEAAQFQAEFALGPDTIDVARVQLVRGASDAVLSGTVARSLSAATLSLDARSIDPQQWIEQWPGNIDVSAQVDIDGISPLQLVASDIVATGELRGYPLTAAGAASFAGEVLTIEGLQIVSRTDRITIDGRISDALDVALEVALADVNLLLPDGSGALEADLQIAGTPARPVARGTLRLQDFSFADVTASTVQITGVAGIAADDPFELAVTGTAVALSDTLLRNVVVSATGTAAAHRLQARLGADEWSASLAADGAIGGTDWTGRLDELEFAPGDFGVWRLVNPADVRYGAGAYSVGELCLAYSLSQICSEVAVAGQPADYLRIAATNFDVGILRPFMPAGIDARGLVDANGELTNFIADPRGAIEFNATDAQVDFELAEGAVLPVPIEALTLAALLDDSGVTLSARVSAAESGNATAALVLGNPRDPDSSVRGTMNLQWNDAAVLGVVSPDIDEITGRLGAQLTLEGTLAAPVFGGKAEWTGGSAAVPAWALLVEDIEASVDASRGNEAAFEAVGRIDETPINVDGTVLLDPQQGWPMQLRLSGENLSLVQLSDIELQVSPTLEAEVRLPEILVTGTVRIPTAHIREVTLPQQASVPSADTVVHGRVVEERGRAIDLIASLSLELGDDVTYQDPNLNATVTGQLDLDYRSGQGAAAQGALTLSGEYVAYGTPLALQRGQLIFVGPLDDPSLDIRAVRTVGEVTAGVQLNGTLRAPITSMFSEPAMSEADALSWLLFGRPLNDARDDESDALRSAALAMGLQQALPVIERIGESLGLDDFSIRNTDTDAGALMAGKYLSPKLYFRYSYGLFNRIGGLLLRYRINEQFSLETRSGEHNSMDLLYTVEKD